MNSPSNLPSFDSSRVHEIENAIAQLTPPEKIQLFQFMGKLQQEAEAADWAVWKAQIAADETSGRLNFLFDEIDEDVKAGRTTPL